MQIPTFVYVVTLACGQIRWRAVRRSYSAQDAITQAQLEGYCELGARPVTLSVAPLAEFERGSDRTNPLIYGPGGSRLAKCPDCGDFLRADTPWHRCDGTPVKRIPTSENHELEDRMRFYCCRCCGVVTPGLVAFPYFVDCLCG